MYGRGNSKTHKNKEAAKAGREHWFNNGSKQSPPLDIKPSYESEKPTKCADYGGECSCPGRVHFGLKKRIDNGDEITTLEDMLNWMQGTKLDGAVTKVKCSRNNFKKDKMKLWKNVTDEDLQCMCEPHNKPDPYQCAGEGDICQCPKGKVFYGAKFQEGTSKLNNFE